MKINEIIAKEMEKTQEERSFHFKQIEKYLNKNDWFIKQPAEGQYYIISKNLRLILYPQKMKKIN